MNKSFNKRNCLFYGAIFIILIISILTYLLSTDEYADANFRTMQDEIVSSQSVDLTGLRELSASGGPILDFPILKKKLNYVKKPIFIIGLAEHQGFIKGIPVSFFGYHRKKPGLRYFLRRIFFTGTPHMKPECIVQESQMAKIYGFSYQTIRINSRYVTSDHAVDMFVAFIDALPKDAWIHFHCRHGKGRASVALVMFDILKNAPQVALEHIFQRQHLLGSVNLSNTAKWRKNSTYPSQILIKRKQFLQDFYIFICQRKAGGIQTWSAWRKQKS